MTARSSHASPIPSGEVLGVDVVALGLQRLGEALCTGFVIERVDARRRGLARDAVLEADAQVDQRGLVGCYQVAHSRHDLGNPVNSDSDPLD